MIRNLFNNQQNQFSRAARRFLIIGGINLILLSIVVFIFPEILAYAVAALLLLAGISLVGYGLRIKDKPRAQAGTYGQTIHYNY